MSDLATFARRLMRINERVVASNTPSAIFGSIGDLPQAVSSRPPLRIGMFPCVSDENPLVAMGLWSVLAHLLDRWGDIEIYRLFVSFNESPEDFVWTLDKSQFTVEDWDIEHLDENIGMWGTLQSTDAGWQLTVTIDDDNLTGADAEEVNVTLIAESQGELFAKLPDFAEQLADTMSAGRLDDTDPAYQLDNLTVDDDFTAVLEHLLEWEVNLLATLWDVEWDDDEIIDAFNAFLNAGKLINSDFSAWLISKSVGQTMRPGYGLIGDLLIDRVTDVTSTFDNSYYPIPILADRVFNMGFAQKSYRFLQNEVEKHPQNVTGWLKLGQVLAEGGLILQAIDTFQSAIEKDAVNSHLYRAYGNILLTAERTDPENNNTFMLIDVAQYEQDYAIWEAIEAYSEALKLDPDDLRACYAKVLNLAEVDFEQEQIWESFVKLVSMDEDGDYTADVIDSFYNISEVDDGVRALEGLIKENPNRLDLYMNLAALHIAAYDSPSALPLLFKAKDLAKTSTQLADVERMAMMANDPEFEYRFGEVVSILDAGNKLQADDVEFLEDLVENAPHAIEGHIALGRSYYAWKEYDEALEVLLDAQESFPDQPLVLDWLARILWESGERETAFTYLNRGIMAQPYNVQLIARAGQYLFDNDQLEEARRYLARAEAIQPKHPMLNAVRNYIAQRIDSDPKKYKDS